MLWARPKLHDQDQAHNGQRIESVRGCAVVAPDRAFGIGNGLGSFATPEAFRLERVPSMDAGRDFEGFDDFDNRLGTGEALFCQGLFWMGFVESVSNRPSIWSAKSKNVNPYRMRYVAEVFAIAILWWIGASLIIAVEEKKQVERPWAHYMLLMLLAILGALMVILNTLFAAAAPL